MKKYSLLLLTMYVLIYAVACNKVTEPDLSDNEQPETTPVVVIETTISEAMNENSTSHESSEDYTWDNSDVKTISLSDNSTTANSSNIIIDGNKITIGNAGTYNISGTLSDGQIIVNTEDKDLVRLIFNGIDISNSSSAPVNIIKSEKIIIVLADNSTNNITDASTYVFDNADEDEPNAALFSKSDLTICGNGLLTVNGNYNDGIASKDGLIIKSGNIIVNAVDDGIRGKDYLIISNGNITVNSQGDGLKSDNDDNADKGYILIENGELAINSANDAITAETDVLISDGKFSLTSGGGSNYSVNDDISTKGIKGLAWVITEGGTLSINSSDDAIHSNKSISINGGSFTISSGDDGIHADSTISINSGTIVITKSYEGIESSSITINYGDINITSSDDGLNGAGGNDGSSVNGRPGQGNFNSSGNYFLNIKGGYVAISAAGDGIDINGSIEMSGGTVIVHGPTSNANGALDYDSSFKITGGLLIAAGSSGMAQAPGSSSTQYSVLINSRTTLNASTIFNIQTGDGSEVLSFAPSKKYQSIVFSSPKLAKGSSYNIYYGGSYSGENKDGLYQNGTYAPGTKAAVFTVSNIVSTISF